MRTPWWKRLMSLSRSARVRNRFVGCLFLRLRLCLCLRLRSRQLVGVEERHVSIIHYQAALA
jgi:hypothetical protein